MACCASHIAHKGVHFLPCLVSLLFSKYACSRQHGRIPELTACFMGLLTIQAGSSSLFAGAWDLKFVAGCHAQTRHIELAQCLIFKGSEIVSRLSLQVTWHRVLYIPRSMVRYESR